MFCNYCTIIVQLIIQGLMASSLEAEHVCVLLFEVHKQQLKLQVAPRVRPSPVRGWWIGRAHRTNLPAREATNTSTTTSGWCGRVEAHNQHRQEKRPAPQLPPWDSHKSTAQIPSLGAIFGHQKLKLDGPGPVLGEVCDISRA